MKKKCPKCQRAYDRDYDVCFICNVALEQENRQMQQGGATISRNNRSPIVSANKQNNMNSNYMNNNMYNVSGQSVSTNAGEQGVQNNVGSGNNVYQANGNTNIQDSYTKKENIFIRIFRRIGIIVTDILNLVFQLLKSLFKSGNNTTCRGIIVSSISTDDDPDSTVMRVIRGLFFGTPFSRDGKIVTFQICELDSAGRPINNRAYNIKVYGNIMNGQLLTNNEVQISGFRERNGEIVANRIMNLNTGTTIIPGRSINMIALRNLAIFLIICSVVMSLIKVPVKPNVQQAQVNQTIQEVQSESLMQSMTGGIIDSLVMSLGKLIESITVLLICWYGFKMLLKEFR